MLKLALVCAAAIACSSRPRVARPAGPIREAAFVKLGGIDQWITIRGASRTNPVLLLVHGGPGDAQSPLSAIYEPYESDFTLVQWDQRGAGRTFGANPTASPEPERVVADGVELAEYLTRRLATPKIIIVGHSWGSHITAGMAQRRPDLFLACVGAGQVGRWTDNVQAQFNFLLARAREAGDHETVAKLEAIGTPDPTSAEQYFSWWSIRNPYITPADRAWLVRIRALVASDPELARQADVIGAGMMFSGEALVGAMLAEDLPRTVPRLDVPFFVIQGADDMITPTSVAAKYFEVVQAPIKKMILIPDAGHFALVTHIEEFRAALIEMIERLTADSPRPRPGSAP